MSKTSIQKLKLLYLRDYLLDQTDETHLVSVSDMAAYLKECGIEAERKALYDDLSLLQDYGLDVIRVRMPNNSIRYYVASRDFELPELKLLVDSVQSSKFITARKTKNLIEKLERLGTLHQAKELQRQVIVSGRVKNMNESVFYNVDGLSSAISNDHAVTFKYYEYNLNKERQFRKGGSSYKVSPFALILDNENYYLLGYDEEDELMKHFRVDKISNLTEGDRKRKGKEQFDEIDLGRYTAKVFGMYHGDTRQVRLFFANHLVGAVIDRFGKDVRIIPEDEEHFSVLADVSVSPQFFGWVLSFGEESTILEPKDVREQYLDHIRRAVAFSESLAK
ncbi:MAG: WYL domain-containing protein [Oscillospiraceae bacterium]|nr:WYL domain-containing protein [Oscillospiraceae bacterium]